jgi:parallel beta-helix repeat protein
MNQPSTIVVLAFLAFLFVAGVGVGVGVFFVYSDPSKKVEELSKPSIIPKDSPLSEYLKHLSTYNLSTEYPVTSHAIPRVLTLMKESNEDPLNWDPDRDSTIQLYKHRETFQMVTKTIPMIGGRVYFTGSNTSSLNAFIASLPAKNRVIHFTNREILITESIRLQSNFSLIGEHTILRMEQYLDRAVFYGENVMNVWVKGFTVKGSSNQQADPRLTEVPSLLHIRISSNIVVSDMIFKDFSLCRFPAVIIYQSKNIQLSHLLIAKCLSGIMISLSHNVLVQKSNIYGTHGYSNLHAGIVATWHELNEQGDFLPPLNQQCDHLQDFSSYITIKDNHLHHLRAQGVYLDVTFKCFVLNNVIEYNIKEGVCSDNGSGANYVANNTIFANGYRYNMTVDNLKMDFIYQHGLLPDGSSPIKLPGLSLDNTAFNVIQNNNVRLNAGSGIKMVRAAHLNIIRDNYVENNRFVYHGFEPFAIHFGINLGYAPRDENDTNPCLEFNGCFMNMVYGNTVKGNHISSILVDRLGQSNLMSENILANGVSFAIEVVSDRPSLLVENHVIDNPSNLRVDSHSQSIQIN